ncbi:GNAT family N-acetyltransferase [Methylobrevis pamukkalensis]|uniref:Acetyltransferase (GNAT) family protein n=1 Tax=Methylobrevis pamukkalensis TaxID=1439726 RepID=A0A1E3GVG8_9HYPH|nr:Acetyltransferase (GNAT) family protein [Methylobrevis pamukkalensis]
MTNAGTSGRDVEIGVATADEVAAMVDWAAAEGWNPGLGDAPLFRLADPEGFLVARVDGEMAATISLVRSGAFAFLGFYICRPDLRGRGIGKRLWDAALAACRATTIGLDGVVAQQANYAKAGFALAHRNIRHEGVVARLAPEDGRLIVPEGEALIAAVTEYDAPLYPGPRAGFVRAWLTAPRHGALAFADAGEVRGYGVIRPCQRGWKIGPLLADTPGIADALFAALAQRAGGDVVVLDTPEPNAAALRLTARHGLTPAFETARMYRGPRPTWPFPGSSASPPSNSGSASARKADCGFRTSRCKSQHHAPARPAGPLTPDSRPLRQCP